MKNSDLNHSLRDVYGVIGAYLEWGMFNFIQIKFILA